MMSLNTNIGRRGVLKALGSAGVAATGAGTVIAQQDDAETDQTELKIIHDTHVHGRFGNPEDDRADIEEYFGLVDHLLSQSDHGTIVGVGDDLGSSALSTEFSGRHVVDAFEAGGVSHDTFGNHDFDFGPETTRRRVAESNFQWVTANVIQDRLGGIFGREQGVKRFDIVDMGPVSVGFTGILTPRAPEVTSLGDNFVIDPVPALQFAVPVMRAAGADIVVVLSHVANDLAMDIANEVDGIDIIVGDDAAEVLGGQEINDTLLGFVGDGYDHLGEITLTIDDSGSVSGQEYTLHETTEAVSSLGVDPHPDVAIVADSYRDRIEREVIGRSEVQLNCITADLRSEETNMGNFVADAVRSDVDADIAIQNGGGIRTDTLYPAGEITDLMINQILPFGNVIVEIEVTGETIMDALENGVSDVETLEGRFPQVSGLQYEWDPDSDPGNRIESVTVGGSDLDMGTTYSLATNGFMTGGGDGYEMLTDASVTEEGRDLAVAVIDRIRSRTPISPEVEGRITRI